MLYSQKLQNIPPYLFAKLEDKTQELRKKGVDIISLGIGDPDLPPPKMLIEAVKRHLDEEDTHFYSVSRGNAGVRKGLAEWFQGRFGVEMDPETEVMVTIGSKEALANFSRAFVDPGDKVGVPNPGYPVYGNGAVILNEGVHRDIPLYKENGFLPRLDDLEGCKIAFLNYPNNPTGAIAPDSFWKELADWIEAHPETIIVSDNAYIEMTFGDYKAPSLIQYTKNAIEFHSLSKLFNCTGYRIGFAVGRKDLIDGLVKVKSQLDSGAPLFIQRAAVDCLLAYDGMTPPQEVLENRDNYARRKKIVEDGLAKLGYKVHRSPATFYTWFETGEDDSVWCEKALAQGLVITPGSGFGSAGKGFARITSTQPENRLKEALERLRMV